MPALPQKLVEASRRLRKKPTDAERTLWRYLRHKQLDGYRFRRQHVIRPYVVDFYCHDANLIIELDGSVHDDPEVYANDIERQNLLEAGGYTVIRFQNRDVFRNLEGVLEVIREQLPKDSDEKSTPHPRPFP
jgi:very-short-patch-repair endonuclease